jgi:folate-binding protein YgfZ
MAQPFPNPLYDVHRQAEAEFLSWADIEIVQTFGEPQAEYAAIRKAAGLIDLPQRGILELTGKDRLPFLNNLLTNQTWDKSTKSGLEAGRGVYAFMLNLRGRIVADLNVLELGDRTFLETEVRLIEPLRQVLDKYLFAEQVQLHNRVAQLHEIALHGPGASEVLGVHLNAELRSARSDRLGAAAIIWRDDQAGVPGYHLILPTDSARSVWMNLIAAHAEDRKLRPIGWAVFNTARIEAGRAILGIDIDAAPVSSALPGKRDDSQTDESAVGALPAETGALLHRAVSFTKGCYLGQEIVARMDARKQIARQIVGARMETDALPIAGAQVFDETQSNVIGVVTSSTISPVLSNAAICLAMLKRPHFSPGTKLRIPAEGAVHSGQVVATPFLNRDQKP